jgi:hypothetical protein
VDVDGFWVAFFGFMGPFGLPDGRPRHRPRHVFQSGKPELAPLPTTLQNSWEWDFRPARVTSDWSSDGLVILFPSRICWVAAARTGRGLLTRLRRSDLLGCRSSSLRTALDAIGRTGEDRERETPNGPPALELSSSIGGI